MDALNEHSQQSEQYAQQLRKTLKCKHKPIPEPERAMECVLRRCRALDNAGLEERREARQKCGVSAAVASQSAPLPDVKAARPAYHTIHSQDLQNVLTRLDLASQAFFRRSKNGEKHRYPRLQRGNQYNSFTCKQPGNGATLNHGFLVLSKIGPVAVRWSRPPEGAPETVTISREVGGWSASVSGADVPKQPLQPTGQETGIDLSLDSFATLADGTIIHNRRCSRRAEASLRCCQRRVSRRKQGSHRRRTAVKLLARAHLKVRRQRRDFHHKVARTLVRQYG